MVLCFDHLVPSIILVACDMLRHHVTMSPEN
jgi:hypothetical protein